jgi:hypothetical protein
LLPRGEASVSTTETLTADREPWYRIVLMFLLAPFALLAALPVFAGLLLLGAYAVVVNLIGEILFAFRMRRCGRFLRRRELSVRIAANESGTLIIESPTLGWGITRAWWTPESVPAICPHSRPTQEEYRAATAKMQCLDWDRWHWDHFTDPDKGKAFLLRAWNGGNLERWLKRTFPNIGVIHTWTALVHVPVTEIQPPNT